MLKPGALKAELKPRPVVPGREPKPDKLDADEAEPLPLLALRKLLSCAFVNGDEARLEAYCCCRDARLGDVEF